ncbi:hypothetical protein CEXT_551091 [Caerostris extrusa]|uniref:Uncharacterized protein n=1 Tax=Caerostris extrusa TaxID=172846 RepID=A0AAV4NLL4_CAEEX|nr:hypothetical protein CEXT_551091 [Caerostris extrusa]
MQLCAQLSTPFPASIPRHGPIPPFEQDVQIKWRSVRTAKLIRVDQTSAAELTGISAAETSNSLGFKVIFVGC